MVWGNDRMGMWIEAKQNRLLIRSTGGGETILYGEKKEGSGVFISALGRSFFTMETMQSDRTQIKTDYAIPDSMSEQAKEAFEQRKIERMVEMFDSSNTERSTEQAMQELLQRPEVRALEETVHRLGESGITGAENRGALLFYTTVLQLVKGREREIAQRNRIRELLTGRRSGKRQIENESENKPITNRTIDLPGIKEETNNATKVIPTLTTLSITACITSSSLAITPTPTILVPSKTPATGPQPCHTPPPPPPNDDYDPIFEYAHHCRKQKWAGQFCEDCHHGRECLRGRCPFEDECLGMCGPGCWWCWSLICGDCCFWLGCLQHDLICQNRFFSWSCLLPFNFRCNGY